MNYKIIIPATEKELKMYYDLRFEVLRKPWGQPESTTKDDLEEQSLHVLMLNEKGNAIAAGRLQYNSEHEGQIRSMAVTKDLQGHGLGTIVLKFLEEKAAEKNLSKIILDARNLAVGFYEKNGYNVERDSYILFGVIPHFRMIKTLHANSNKLKSN